MTYQTIMAFIVGALAGNLFGMFLMAMFVAAAQAGDADRAYRKYKVNKQSANEYGDPGTCQGIRSHASKLTQETDIRETLPCIGLFMEGTDLCSQGFVDALLQYPEGVEDGHPLTQQDLVCLKCLDLHLHYNQLWSFLLQ